MNEAEAASAIVKDFAVKPADIRREEGGAEHTHILAVTVPDLLPKGGAAEIAYVFGFESHKLVQIGVTWSKASDPAISAEQLYADAKGLRGYFEQAGYRPETIVHDRPFRGGVLLFRGSDAKGHATILILYGERPPTAPQIAMPDALALYYIADPRHPDVFRLPPGQF